MTSTCSNCRYWQSITGPHLEDNERGECRRHAPPAGSPPGSYAAWAETWEEDWCGDWAERPADRTQRIQKQNADNLRRARRACNF